MKKYVIISSNENEQYLFYLPLVVWAWRKLGWEPVLLVKHTDLSYRLITEIKDLRYYILKDIDGYQTDTIAQCSRLFASLMLDDDSYIMTSDIDMLPLSDYWKPSYDGITTWGHDLTNYQHVPICYIGASKKHWDELMGLDHEWPLAHNMEKELILWPQAKSEDSVKRWVVDQDIITNKISSEKIKVMNICRGSYMNGYPVGRVDRSAWSLDHPQLIDCHLPRGMWKLDDTGVANFAKVMRLLYTVWPNENFDWFKNYVEEFRKLVP